jgi:hypothetical protein
MTDHERPDGRFLYLRIYIFFNYLFCSNSMWNKIRHWMNEEGQEVVRSKNSKNSSEILFYLWDCTVMIFCIQLLCHYNFYVFIFILILRGHDDETDTWDESEMTLTALTHINYYTMWQKLIITRQWLFMVIWFMVWKYFLLLHFFLILFFVFFILEVFLSFFIFYFIYFLMSY